MAVLVEQRTERRFSIGPANVYPYPSHMHNAMEIVILRRGSLTMTVNGERFTLEPDTAIVVFPGVIHSYENASEDAQGLFVGVTPDLIEEYRNAMSTLQPVNPTIRLSDCEADLETAVSRLESFIGREPAHPLTQAYIHLLLACLIQKLELVPPDEQNRNTLLQDVIRYMQEHSRENLSLNSVAKEIGISQSHLSHLFSQKLHIHFRQLLNTIRIEKACRMLHDPARSVKEVCYECGFESTRTFHRVFMAEQKMTPGEYQKKMADSMGIEFNAMK